MAVVEGARERARGLVPFETKLRPAYLRDGIVPRPELERRLQAQPAATVFLVVAPAGYGKTTLLAQWAERDHRPTGWISITPGDNDPAVLLTYIALALDSIEPLAPDAFAELANAQADLEKVRLPRLGRVVAECPRPFLFVFDDVHMLRTPEALGIIATLVAHVPTGSQVVIAGRREPELSLPRLMMQGRMTRLDTSSLAMSDAEGRELLLAAGVELSPRTGKGLVETTEGWAAGLYLASLALRGDPSPELAAQRFNGADRLMVDYARDEMLRALDPDLVDFLVRTSVLERLSGPLCDAVLQQTGSTATLEQLARSNLLLIPLDREGNWYRYHHLLADMLRSELGRREPGGESELHRRAADWWEAAGNVSHAILHAHAAGDERRAAELVWRAAPIFISGGRAATVAQWLDRFSEDEVRRQPILVLTRAWWALGSGDFAAIAHWTAIAERFEPDTTLPDGTPVRAAVALLAALVGNDGLTRQRDDARRAVELHPADNPYRVLALGLEGTAHRLLGDPRAARSNLEEAVRQGGGLLPAMVAPALAQLAALAVDEEDWTEAARHVDRALRMVTEHDLGAKPPHTALFAVATIVHAHDGDVALAAREAKHAWALLDSLVGISPWMAIDARLYLARAAVTTGDAATARQAIREADRLLSKYPDPGVLPDRLETARAQADAAIAPLGAGVPALTPAELRVLRFLPTHLNFGEIAEQLFVSRNTVKTQALSVYRKFGVSSRTAAVEHAQAVGIL